MRSKLRMIEEQLELEEVVVCSHVCNDDNRLTQADIANVYKYVKIEAVKNDSYDQVDDQKYSVLTPYFEPFEGRKFKVRTKKGFKFSFEVKDSDDIEKEQKFIIKKLDADIHQLEFLTKFNSQIKSWINKGYWIVAFTENNKDDYDSMVIIDLTDSLTVIYSIKNQQFLLRLENVLDFKSQKLIVFSYNGVLESDDELRTLFVDLKSKNDPKELSYYYYFLGFCYTLKCNKAADPRVCLTKFDPWTNKKKIVTLKNIGETNPHQFNTRMQQLGDRVVILGDPSSYRCTPINTIVKPQFYIFCSTRSQTR